MFKASQVRNIPHAGKQLHQSTVTESKRNNQTGRSNVSCLDIDQRQHKCGEGESAETQRRWVGKATVWRPVETRLELSTERLQTQLWVVGRHVRQGVAAIVVGRPLPRVAVLCVVDSAALLVDAGSTLGQVNQCS